MDLEESSTGVDESLLESCRVMLREFLQIKRETSPNWNKFRIILSDNHECGEGEHKIINYMRNSYGNPSETHCLYSNDADVILLSLASRIENICILQVVPPKLNFRDLVINSR